jgi:acyl-CoA synthetase (AMP-forming)/AMP-acid ligase II
MSSGRGLELEAADASPVVVSGASVVTRGELKQRADALLELMTAHAVKRALVRSDDPVHILRALDASSRAQADLWIAHTNIPAAFVDDACQKFGIELKIDERDELHEAPTPGEAPRSRVLMTTSGTTGRPKVAAHTLDSLLSRVRAGASLPANREGKWLLTYQPTGFAGIQVLLTAVLSGGVVVAPEQRTPAGFYEAARRHGVTQISATPTFWRSFLMVAPPDTIDLRQITLGGEASDQATLDRLKAAFPRARITHIYASTEAGVVFAVHDGREGFPRAWLEKPNQGVELRIRDGFLQIKTLNAMRGYVTEATQPLLDDGWLATADSCEIMGDRVRIVGRQDSTINVGGSKVYPLAVETFLLSLPGVLEARVFGVANPVSGALVGAEVVLADGEDRDAARTRILAACREKLAGYQVPRIFKIVDSIQVGASGKKG